MKCGYSKEILALYIENDLPTLEALDKVAGVATLNQSDGIHPNVEGARIVADTVWNVLKPMVDAASAS